MFNRDLFSSTSVRPYAFLSGFVVGLIILSVAGRLVSQTNYVVNFQRWHRYLSPDAIYYPTASQFRMLAHESVAPGQVMVIVGGSSVMEGVGQGSTELWTDELQRHLGDSYKVLNYAAGGGAMTDGSGVAAQILHKDGARLIFVSDLSPFGGIAPDGLRNKYVFWDAYYKGLLPEAEGRMERIEQLGSQPGFGQDLDENRLRGMLESVFYHTDFWNWVGYNYFFTVPNVFTQMPFTIHTAPRKRFPDPVEHAIVRPLAERYQHNIDGEVNITRGVMLTACERNADGTLVDRPMQPPRSTPFDIDAEMALPPGVRQQTLIVLMPESPFYTDRLSDAERACYFKARPRMEVRLSWLGYHSVHAGLGMTAEDYADRVHLLPSGGRKLAADVAVGVRSLAAELGYVTEAP